MCRKEKVMCDATVRENYIALKDIIRMVDVEELICPDHESFCWMYGLISCNQGNLGGCAWHPSVECQETPCGLYGFGLFSETAGWDKSCQRNAVPLTSNEFDKEKGIMIVRDIYQGDPVSDTFRQIHFRIRDSRTLYLGIKVKESIPSRVLAYRHKNCL